MMSIRGRCLDYEASWERCSSVLVAGVDQVFALKAAEGHAFAGVTDVGGGFFDGLGFLRL